jgi:hypothetical protein
MWLGELGSSNPLRIPRPKIDKLACQAQGVGIFAVGEIPLLDAQCIYFKQYSVVRYPLGSDIGDGCCMDSLTHEILYHRTGGLSIVFWGKGRERLTRGRDSGIMGAK